MGVEKIRMGIHEPLRTEFKNNWLNRKFYGVNVDKF